MNPSAVYFSSKRRWWYGFRLLKPIWCFISLSFFVAIVIIIVLLAIYLSRGSHSQKPSNTHQCFDDPSGMAPYDLSQNQSVLQFDPTVKIGKNQPFSTCTWVPEGFTSTPEKDCPSNSQYVLTPMIPMANSSNLFTTMARAAKFIRDSCSNTSIEYFQNLSTIHCSIQYFSCYNYLEYLTIQRIFANFNWTSFTITFNQVSCDVTTVGSYLIVEANSLSQEKLFHFVRRLEAKIVENGIKVYIPRLERFHMTLAGVTYSYPSDCMVKKLNTELTPKLIDQQFGSVRVCCFITKIALNITFYYAQDCNPNESCIFPVL